MSNIFQKLYNAVDYSLGGILPYGAVPYWESANVGDVVIRSADIQSIPQTQTVQTTGIFTQIKNAVGNISIGAVLGVGALLYFMQRR